MMGRRWARAAALLLVAAAACARTAPLGELPARRPDLDGLITQVQRGAAGPAVIFVERNPSDAPRIGSGTPKWNVVLEPGTRVVERTPAGHYADADRRGLVLGRVVRIWFADSTAAAAGGPRPAVARLIVMHPLR